MTNGREHGTRAAAQRCAYILLTCADMNVISTRRCYISQIKLCGSITMKWWLTNAAKTYAHTVFKALQCRE